MPKIFLEKVFSGTDQGRNILLGNKFPGRPFDPKFQTMTKGFPNYIWETSLG